MKYTSTLALLLFLFISPAICQQQKIKTSNGEYSISRYAANIFKISFQPTAYTINENVSDAVILKPSAEKPQLIHRKAKDVQSLIYKDVAIDFFNGKISFASNKGPAIEMVLNKKGYNGFSIQLKEGEKIFGGGERALPLNRRGYAFPLYNNPWYGYSNGADALNFSVPFFTSSNGYGLFFDNGSKGYADIGKTNSNIFEAGFVSGELNVYVILGKDYKDILSSYYKLTGTQPLPPRWALGNFMSRFGYSSEANVNDILGKMKANRIPVDAIIFDLFWFGDSIKNTLGNLDWVNKEKWPNPKKMMEGFTKQNINTILIAEPFILNGTRTFNEAEKFLSTDNNSKPFQLQDFYFGKGGLLDIFRKDAGDWIWKDHYKRQLANGASAWWTDLGEPEKHPADMMHNLKDLGFKRLFKADEVHNVYGHYWNKMLYSNYAKELPNTRLFHLNRSGFSGSQRYSIFPWSGDISRSWSGLQAQLPVMLGMSMSGIPYIHADAGGFAGGEGDNELYVRWLQFASFTPIFRPHGTALYEIDKNAFSFPSEPALIEEPYRTYAKEVINMRYALLPYNYTLAYKQASKGEPLVAPLYYYYPKDTAAANTGDEFMWGENILVAPVLQKGATERNIYLPAGKWYGLYDTTLNEGGKWLSPTLSIQNIPVFVKEGSLIPMWLPTNKLISSTKEYNGRDVEIIYYPSDKPSTGMLYNDDGISKTPVAETISFTAVTVGNKIKITISSSNKGLYSNGMVRNLKIGSFKQIAFPGTGKINGKAISSYDIVKGNYAFNHNTIFNFIKVPFNGQPVTLEISLAN